jgi:hypothetical protein
VAEVDELERLDVAKQALHEALDVLWGRPGIDKPLTEKLLGTYALLYTGRRLETTVDEMSLNDGTSLSLLQEVDLLEYRSGYPPHRHEWMHGLDRRNRINSFGALIRRMYELEQSDNRDIELERATIEMGCHLIMSPDEHGSLLLQGMQIRSIEIFRPTDNEPELFSRVRGIPLNCAQFKIGSDLGFKDENKARWFITSGGSFAQLDRITEFLSPWDDEGELRDIEFAPQPIVFTPR